MMDFPTFFVLTLALIMLVTGSILLVIGLLTKPYRNRAKRSTIQQDYERLVRENERMHKVSLQVEKAKRTVEEGAPIHDDQRKVLEALLEVARKMAEEEWYTGKPISYTDRSLRIQHAYEEYEKPKREMRLGDDGELEEL